MTKPKRKPRGVVALTARLIVARFVAGESIVGIAASIQGSLAAVANDRSQYERIEAILRRALRKKKAGKR